jgi:hypothetical protein
VGPLIAAVSAKDRLILGRFPPGDMSTVVSKGAARWT